MKMTGLPPSPPPFFDPPNVKVDGLAFVGLSLARPSARGHPTSSAHQTAFDLDRLTDRDYRYVLSTSDDGWLVGGGEPPHSTHLPAADSAHVELMHVSTFDPVLGGVPHDALLRAFVQCQILIPEITVVPTSVVLTDRGTLQIRFDMESAYHDDENENDKTEHATDSLPALPVNWQLRFIHNQLFRYFHHPARYCRDPFSCDLAHDVTFRSPTDRATYLDQCNSVIATWRHEVGPQRLAPLVTRNITRVTAPMKHVLGGIVGSSFDDRYRSGLWLFRNRHTPTHTVSPNFLPPYNTPSKRAVIFDVLSEQWDAVERVWQPAPPLPKPNLMLVAAARRRRPDHHHHQQQHHAVRNTTTRVVRDDDDNDDTGVNDNEEEKDERPPVLLSTSTSWACGAVDSWSLSSPSTLWCAAGK